MKMKSYAAAYLGKRPDLNACTLVIQTANKQAFLYCALERNGNDVTETKHYVTHRPDTNGGVLFNIGGGIAFIPYSDIVAIEVKDKTAADKPAEQKK